MNSMESRICAVLVVFLTTCIIAQFSFASPLSQEKPESDVLPKVKEILTKITDYDYGQSRLALTELTDLVRLSLGSPAVLAEIEKSMNAFLQTDASFASKQFICKQLSIIGTEESIPVLAGMLETEKTADIALYALERIPGPAVDATLMKALSGASGNARIGIINTLGQRRSQNAPDLLAKLAYSDNSDVAASALAALGKIANDSASMILADAKDKITGPLQIHALDAYLNCADEALARGESEKAGAIFCGLFTCENPSTIRAAALRGMVHVSPDSAEEIILDVLSGDDDDMKAIAIGMLRELPKSQNMTAIAAKLPDLSSQGQVQLLTAFADRGDLSVRPAALEATGNGEEEVRIAALKALKVVGKAEDVIKLAKCAAESSGQERETARESLSLLRGTGVDAEILSQIPEADTDVKVELIKTLGQRQVENATGILFETASDPEGSVRRESYKALALLATPDDLSELTELLMEAGDTGDRRELERTLVAVAQKRSDQNSRVKEVLDALPSVEDDDVRISLLSVVGRIGDPKGLSVLRESLSSPSEPIQTAAIRALSEWPDAAPLDDLFSMAKKSGDKTRRILALRGYIGMLKKDVGRSEEEILKSYKAAMKLADEPNEKRMVLSGLSSVPSLAAMKTVAKSLSDSELKAEAEVAIVAIAKEMESNELAKAKKILEKVLKTTGSESVREDVKELLEDIG